LVLLNPRETLRLMGQEHGRAIPLADLGKLRAQRLSTPSNVICEQKAERLTAHLGTPALRNPSSRWPRSAAFSYGSMAATWNRGRSGRGCRNFASRARASSNRPTCPYAAKRYAKIQASRL